MVRLGRTSRFRKGRHVYPRQYMGGDSLSYSFPHPLSLYKKQARKLQATLVRNYDPPTDLLTGVKCRATSVAKKGLDKTMMRTCVGIKVSGWLIQRNGWDNGDDLFWHQS